MAGTGEGSGVPPGFRFHPTDEELLHFYLKKKITFQKFDMDVIREVDLNKIEPWELQERCSIGSTPQNEWYFFSHKDRKYPTGSRTNRATGAGFWKATGRDKCIRNNSSLNKIGMRKTLVFYGGRAPHGKKTEWIMHEYRLDDDDPDHNIITNDYDSQQPTTCDPPPQEDGWVVCRVFKKKNLFKAAGGNSSGGGSNQSHLTTTIRRSSSSININQHNLYSHDDHHIPILPSPHPPYPQPQNLIISPYQNNQMIKPLMLTDNNNYHHPNLPMAESSMLQVKQLTREDCETTSPTGYQESRDHIAGDGDHEWDHLVVVTSHHDQQATNQINHQLCEMDFWAYGK